MTQLNTDEILKRAEDVLKYSPPKSWVWLLAQDVKILITYIEDTINPKRRRDDYFKMRDRIKFLKDENAKLREALNVMLKDLVAQADSSYTRRER